MVVVVFVIRAIVTAATAELCCPDGRKKPMAAVGANQGQTLDTKRTTAWPLPFGFTSNRLRSADSGRRSLTSLVVSVVTVASVSRETPECWCCRCTDSNELETVFPPTNRIFDNSNITFSRVILILFYRVGVVDCLFENLKFLLS